MKSLKEVNLSKEDLSERLQVEETSVTSLREINQSLRGEMEETRVQSVSDREALERMKNAVNQLKEKLLSKEAECQVAKECVKQLKLPNDAKTNIEEILDVNEVGLYYIKIRTFK